MANATPSSALPSPSVGGFFFWLPTLELTAARFVSAGFAELTYTVTRKG